jgi:hypothetical protein
MKKLLIAFFIILIAATGFTAQTYWSDGESGASVRAKLETMLAELYAHLNDTSSNPHNSGDVNLVGDCTGGDCYDGSADGGTYVRLHDSGYYVQLDTTGLSANITINLPATGGTLSLNGHGHLASSITHTDPSSCYTSDTLQGLVEELRSDNASGPNASTVKYTGMKL